MEPSESEEAEHESSNPEYQHSDSENQPPAPENQPPASENQPLIVLLDQTLGYKPLAGPLPWTRGPNERLKTLAEIVQIYNGNIYGELTCKSCNKTIIQEVSITNCLPEIRDDFTSGFSDLDGRVGRDWLRPIFRDRCDICSRTLLPLITHHSRESEINWLYLLLVKGLRYCEMKRLKHFAAETGLKVERSLAGAIFNTVIELLCQMEPDSRLAMSGVAMRIRGAQAF